MAHPFPQQEFQNKLSRILEHARHRGMDAAEAFLLKKLDFPSGASRRSGNRRAPSGQDCAGHCLPGSTHGSDNDFRPQHGGYFSSRG